MRWAVPTSYTYDAVGNQSTVTDSEGGVTRYEYDLLGRGSDYRCQRSTTTYAYDNEGRQALNRASATPLNYSASKTYDAIGQLQEADER